MRRRERLTGFFIIFILLTFSAYSSSVNVGGRSLNSSAAGNTISSERVERSARNTSPKITAQNSNQNNTNPTDDRNNDKNVIAEESSVDNRNDSQSEAEQNKKEKTFSEGREKEVIPDQREDGVFENKAEPHLMERISVHTVRSGETLWDIAHKHGLNIDSLIGANNISNMNSIKPGQEFKILPVKGILYRVSPGESIYSIADKFDISPQTILSDNNIAKASHLKIDQTLILRGAKPEFSYRDRLEKKFMYPIKTRITSYYGPRWGRMHEGIDFAAPMGSPIRAVSSGRVVYSGWASGYGKVVIVEHQKGLRTLYAHNSSLLVRNGERVGKGEVIARSGNTGNSTGPHLHFEVQVNGRPENPLNYLNK